MEYIILVAIIAIASLGIVKVLGHTVTTQLSKITATLQGRDAESIPKPKKVEEKHYKERGLDDFYESSE